MPHVLAWDVDFLAVHGEVDSSKEPQIKSCSGDDNVGIQLLATVEQDAIADHILDGICNNTRTIAVQALEEVTVGAQAKSLLPRVVARLEVRINRKVGG